MSAQAVANKSTGAIRKAIGVRLVTLQDRLLDLAEAKAGQQWRDMLKAAEQMEDTIMNLRHDIARLL